MTGDLKKASRLFRSGKYTQVIRLLEPQIFRFRESYTYYYLVGSSCLRTGDVGGAGTYLQRCLTLKAGDTAALLTLAAVHLKRGELQDAIRCYLDVLEEEPRNGRARRAMALIRRDPQPERIAELAEGRRLLRLLPADHAPPRVVGILVTLVVTAAVAAGAVRIAATIEPRGDRSAEVAGLSLRNIPQLSSLQGGHRYILTEKEITEAFGRAKDYFSRYRDNLAMRELNRLLLSNASYPVQEQARTIARYIGPPDFTSIRDSFSFAEISADAFLHDGCYVAWKGKISNLAAEPTEIRFDLLVGYEDEKVLEGIVPVVLRFAVILNQGDPLEVLGRVVVDAEGRFRLEGASVHRLPPPSRR